LLDFISIDSPIINSIAGPIAIGAIP